MAKIIRKTYPPNSGGWEGNHTTQHNRNVFNGEGNQGQDQHAPHLVFRIIFAYLPPPEKTRSKRKSALKDSLENGFIELRSCLCVGSPDHRQQLFRIIFATGGQDAEARRWNQC